MNLWNRIFFILPLTGVFSASAAADDAGVDFFEKKIRPVLVQHCYRCHSAAKKVRGGLMLDTKLGVLKGGETGPSVVPGKPGKSLLIKAIHYTDADLKMPPKGKLPAQIIADLEKWVAMGVPDPRTGKKVVKEYGVSVEEGRKFWAFKPPKKHALPKVKDAAWSRGAIDHFILSKLENKGIRPAKDADRVTLIRRAYYALIGLPPTPKQIDDFVADKSPKAFIKVIDQLLASTHFGERWARHWLDVARFAETTGGGRSLLMPEAWRYRDYVIHAFNTDKPYNRFVMEQIAGDLLNSGDLDERTWQIIATAFLLLGPINYEQQDKPLLEADVIDEQLDTLGRAFLGMTIGCARCHDHKFDPIPTKDYYALAGILKSTKSLVHSNVSKWMERSIPSSPQLEAKIKAREFAIIEFQNKIKLAKAAAQKNGTLAALGPLAVKDIPGIVVDDIDANRVGKWNRSVYKNTFIGTNYLYASPSGAEVHTLTFTPKIEKEADYEVRLAFLQGPNRATNTHVRIFHADGEKTVKINQRKTPEIDGRWVSLGQFHFTDNGQWFVMVTTKGAKGGVVVADAVQFLHEDELAKQRPVKSVKSKKEEPKYNLQILQAQLKHLQKKGPKRQKVMGVGEAEKIGDFYVCIRGVVHNKGPSVPRGFLQVATLGPMPKIPAKDSGRKQLAEWLASPKNPLTARVMVNRVWHHLFGCGIVKTTDNLGATGDTPSHPELLDYLAVRFVEEGWSVKKLIREIVLSRTWQLSSHAGDQEAGNRADPQNRLLWRQNRRRLEAEAIRDTILFVSGQLDKNGSGPTMKSSKVVEREYKFTDTRRSVYTPILRNNLHELFAVFDFPDPNLVSGRRAVSTVAPQALYLMNGPFVGEQAKHAAKRTLATGIMDNEQRITLAYRTALGRLPTERERDLAAGYLNEIGAGASPQQKQAAWERFYQVLFACIDFRYVK